MKRIVSSLVILALLVGAIVLGCPAPAAFSISNLTIQPVEVVSPPVEPVEVVSNETVIISVSVANTGGSQGSYNVVLNINGMQEEVESVTIAADASESVTFSVTREDAGTYEVSIDGLSGSFTVLLAGVTFPDGNLEAAIRDALGKPAGEDITAAELLNLTTTLWALFSDITDLTGLEYCTNLTELNIYGNQISDISALSSLTNLSQLRLNYNQISDISPLASLTNMILLYLGENQISDISALSSLTNLTLLDLDGNQVSDISPLSSLTNLAALSLNGNQISDISALSSLTNLITLRLGENQISDISPLVENSGLGAGDQVWIEENDLDLSEGSDDMANIRALEDRGVTVHY